MEIKSPEFQTLVKLSDGVFENQNFMYTGAEIQPTFRRYSTIKILEYDIFNPVAAQNPEKKFLRVSKLEVVKTAAVRHLKHSP